jgi:aryl-alcohol dehydrogenase-like predicted oxidoreductase
MESSLQTVRLGQAGPEVPAIGVGAWQWGDSAFWGYGRSYGRGEVDAAFAASLAAGLRFIDTAEIYGRGRSEKNLGELLRGTVTPLVIATKYAPLPYRVSARTLGWALNRSLKRLGLARVDLYQVHWPPTFIRIEALMHALADAVEAGKVRQVGVSNFSAREMYRAHDILSRRGQALAANQVEYSLLHREPERNGVLAACGELGATLIAYSPIAKGALSGKYRSGAPPPGLRRFSGDFRGGGLRRAEALVAVLRRIGEAHAKTPSQVALNWLIGRPGILAIPGPKNARQAEENAGALGWSLTEEERAELDQISA